MNKRTKNIYITNDSGYNFSSAKEFLVDGDFIPVTVGRVNIMHTDSLMGKIKFIIDDMNADDYILISGNSVVASLVVTSVMNKFGYINLLLWNAPEYTYFHRKITITDGDRDYQMLD